MRRFVLFNGFAERIFDGLGIKCAVAANFNLRRACRDRQRLQRVTILDGRDFERSALVLGTAAQRQGYR
jgi:hypothetical protein